MTQKEEYGNMIWNWNGKSIKLKDLNQGQLHSIKQTLSRNNNSWWGQKKSVWISAINPFINKCENDNIKNIQYNKNKRMINEAHEMVNQIFKCILKQNKTLI